MSIALMNWFIGCWEYNMKLVVVNSSFQVLLVPNYRDLRYSEAVCTITPRVLYCTANDNWNTPTPLLSPP